MNKDTLADYLAEALEKYYQSKVVILEQLKLDDIL